MLFLYVCIVLNRGVILAGVIRVTMSSSMISRRVIIQSRLVSSALLLPLILGLTCTETGRVDRQSVGYFIPALLLATLTVKVEILMA